MEWYKNLTVEVLSFDNSGNLQFDALTDLCAELGVRPGNSIFTTHETARLDMKKQTEEISKKSDFFDGEDDKKNVKIKSDTKMDDIETILYSSPKRENDIYDIETIPYVSWRRKNDIDDRETIAYASPRKESKDEIDEKIYKEPKLETAVEIERQTAEREKKIIKSELEQDKVDIQVSRESDIKKVQDVFDEVKEEEPLNVENFFIDDNDIFGCEEISNADREFIIDLINKTNFVADAKKFVEESNESKMEIIHPEEIKIEKKEQMSIDDDGKREM